METKETSYKKLFNLTTVKFLSYTILIGFILMLITIWVNYGLDIANLNSLPLSIALSLMCGIFIFYLLRFICKSSTIEAFRKDKLSVENSKFFLKYMNLFYIICVIFSIVVCLGYLLVDNYIFINASNHFPELASAILDEYNNTFIPKLWTTIIMEISLVVSFFSLIPYQEKVFEKCNQ